MFRRPLSPKALIFGDSWGPLGGLWALLGPIEACLGVQGSYQPSSMSPWVATASIGQLCRVLLPRFLDLHLTRSCKCVGPYFPPYKPGGTPKPRSEW